MEFRRVLFRSAEEVWQSRFPSEEGSVHFLEWPEVDAKWKADTLDAKWSAIRSAREEVTEAIEPLRREKTIRSSLEAEVSMGEIAEAENIDFAEICIVAKVDMQPGGEGGCVKPSDSHNSGSCWRMQPNDTEEGAL